MKKFGLSKKERIKLKRHFNLVYTKGKVIYSPAKKIKATYYHEDNRENAGVKVAFAVYKKAGKAVWRNRVKRLLREAYRLNKSALVKTAIDKGKFLLIVFSPYGIEQKRNKKIYLKDIMPEVIDLMNIIKQDI